MTVPAKDGLAADNQDAAVRTLEDAPRHPGTGTAQSSTPELRPARTIPADVVSRSRSCVSAVMPSMMVSCGWVPCSTTSAWMPGAVSAMNGR